MPRWNDVRVPRPFNHVVLQGHHVRLEPLDESHIDALVAAADGTISSEEKQKMAGFIRNSDELKHFAMPDVIVYFEKVVGNFDFDAAIGKAEALKLIGRLRGNPEQARVMVRVACAIGASDGNFDQKERAVVREICVELGLNPSDFDL